jgi:hypothetical protein
MLIHGWKKVDLITIIRASRNQENYVPVLRIGVNLKDGK